MNISYAGCGFLGIYHVGVMACLRKHGIHLKIDTAVGSSSGALAAACHVCNTDLGVMMASMLKGVTVVRKRTLRAFSPAFDVNKALRTMMDEILPVDAHKLCNGKLFISCTRVYDQKNVLLSEFSSREELIEALSCSSFIPGFTGLIPLSMKGVRYIDGCYSDNMSALDDNTITVSPFAGEGDICPKDNTPGIHKVYLNTLPIELNAENLQRIKYILFPPTAKVFYTLCEQGYQDTVAFLQTTNLIKCSSCLDLERINCHGAPLKWKDMVTYNPGSLDSDHCKDCDFSKQEALLDNLPDDVDEVLQLAIIEAKNDFVQFLFQFNLIRIIALLWQPVVFIYDLLIMLFVLILEFAISIWGNRR